MVDVINDFASKESKFVDMLVTAIDELRELKMEYDVRGLNSIITDDDLTGDNAHITAAALADVFNTLAVITTAIDTTGHLGNLYRVLPYNGPSIRGF